MCTGSHCGLVCVHSHRALPIAASPAVQPPGTHHYPLPTCTATHQPPFTGHLAMKQPMLITLRLKSRQQTADSCSLSGLVIAGLSALSRPERGSLRSRVLSIRRREGTVLAQHNASARPAHMRLSSPAPFHCQTTSGSSFPPPPCQPASSGNDARPLQ